MKAWLTNSELIELTGKIRPSAQARELRHMRIDFRRRRDGAIVVLRRELECHERITNGKPTINLKAV